jgi:hypothetical protein
VAARDVIGVERLRLFDEGRRRQFAQNRRCGCSAVAAGNEGTIPAAAR